MGLFFEIWIITKSYIIQNTIKPVKTQMRAMKIAEIPALLQIELKGRNYKKLLKLVLSILSLAVSVATLIVVIKIVKEIVRK